MGLVGLSRRQLRRIAWPAFAVLLVGVFIALTIAMARFAVDAGVAARIVAVAAWIGAFAVGWRMFSRSHGDTSRAEAPRQVPSRLVQWGPVLGAVAGSVLLDLDTSAQMIGLALVSGFFWPAFYWIIRAFVRHPHRRERLWNPAFDERDGSAFSAARK